MKNIAFYVFWEKEGKVRDYVLYYLQSLRDVAQRILVVINGELTPESQKKLEAAGIDYIKRPNQGFYFAGWQAAIKHIGWTTIESYDNLILCNSSCYGPIYPFQEAFERMSQSNADFWGLTRHSGSNALLIPHDPTSKIHPHIQSYFMVFRNNVMTSPCFREWWNTMTQTANWSEAVAYHEVRFTQFLEKHGFVSGCLADGNEQVKLCDGEDVMALMPEILLQEVRLPLMKRELFTSSWRQWIMLRLGYHPRKALDIVRTTSDYPERYIWEDILATCKMSDIKDNLHLNYILPSERMQYKEIKASKRDVALFCYAYYPDLAPSMCQYIRNMPADASVYIVSSREDTLEAYRQELDHAGFKHLEFIIKPNRGRDIAAYLVTGRNILQKHELVCCIHDKKTKHIPPLRAADFAYHCIDNCLHSPGYVENVISLFSREPHCGMLVQPTVYYSGFNTIGSETGNNMKHMKALHSMLDMKCPVDDVPVASFGTCFWARGKALVPMFRKSWKIEDFPDEPLPPDATISHGVERIFPIAAQDAGYYVAWCSPDSYSAIYMNSLAFKIREYNTELYRILGKDGWPIMLRKLKMHKGEFADLQSEVTRSRKKKYLKKRRHYKILDSLTLGLLHQRFKKKLKKYKKKIGMQ